MQPTKYWIFPLAALIGLALGIALLSFGLKPQEIFMGILMAAAGVYLVTGIVQFFTATAAPKRFRAGRHLTAAGMLVCALAVLLSPSGAFAATCIIKQAATPCPASTVCLSWTAVTTRTDGTPLPIAEIKGYQLALDGVLLPLTTATATTLNYGVAQGKTLSATSIWQVAVIDSNGLSSDTSSCTQPVAVSGPKLPPAAVTGFSVGS